MLHGMSITLDLPYNSINTILIDCVDFDQLQQLAKKLFETHNRGTTFHTHNNNNNIT